MFVGLRVFAILCVLGAIGICGGFAFARALTAHAEEDLPERMVDYCGFVATGQTPE